MKKKKLIMVLLILCMISFFGTIGLLISMNSIDKQTEQSTTEFMATVTHVETTYTEKNTYIEVYTEEYGTMLYISTTISRKINIDDITNLQNGQKILFRVENNKLDEFEKAEFVNVVSLKTTEKEIFSLSSYNEYIHESVIPARITGIVLITVFALVSAYCVLLLKGINVFHILKK